MLMIRLQRIGKKHQPAYRLVVGEKRDKLNGRQLEDLGWFNPVENKQEFNKDRILHWLKMGAGKSATVHNLILAAGIITGKKMPAHSVKKVAATEKPKVEVKAETKAEPKAEAKAEAAPAQA